VRWDLYGMLDMKKIKRATSRVERATSYNNLDIARPVAVVSHAASPFGFPEPEGKSKSVYMLKSSRVRVHNKKYRRETMDVEGKKDGWRERGACLFMQANRNIWILSVLLHLFRPITSCPSTIPDGRDAERTTFR
jgi:hypothetical protein